MDVVFVQSLSFNLLILPCFYVIKCHDVQGGPTGPMVLSSLLELVLVSVNAW